MGQWRSKFSLYCHDYISISFLVKSSYNALPIWNSLTSKENCGINHSERKGQWFVSSAVTFSHRLLAARSSLFSLSTNSFCLERSMLDIKLGRERDWRELHCCWLLWTRYWLWIKVLDGRQTARSLFLNKMHALSSLFPESSDVDSDSL